MRTCRGVHGGRERPVASPLEFGIYRDGDNNLDREQALVINQALRVSSNEPSIEFVVEDTTTWRTVR